MPRKNRDATAELTPDSQSDENGCVHNWAIEPPNGPVSIGTCADCGDKKEFRNSVEMSYWDNKRKHIPENLPPKKGAASTSPAPAARKSIRK